jgi:tetratricopeptide (TPR) repeat protein
VTLSFPIDDLRKSVPEAAGLDGLSGDSLIDALRQVLGKLSDGAAITVADGMVTLDFGDVPAANVMEAQRLYLKAATCAGKGEFPKATSLYRRVLELDPSRQDARRELAMVLLETGKPDDAVDTLLDVLKTDPRDARALVILGNHYARQDGQRDTALKLIRRACEVAPDDATAHNSLGGLLFEEKLTDQAVAEFNHAIRLDSKLANAYYGRSMVEMEAADWTAARNTLQSMFESGNLADSRLRRMLQAARDNFLKITNIIANDRASESFKASQELKAKAESVSGFPIVTTEKPLAGTLCALTKAAWSHGRNHHVIELQARLPAEMVKHHVIAHESWHLILAGQARANGSNRFFITTDERIDAAVGSMQPEIQRIARKGGYEEAKLTEMVARVAQDGLSLLFNGPLDIVIEKRIATVEELREAQFCSLVLQAHNAAAMGLKPENRAVIPAVLIRLNDVINGTMAIFIDRLTGGATDFTALYAATPTFKLARQVEALAYEHDGPPGSEYDLVDQVAGLLGLRDWYQWRPDPGTFTPPAARRPTEA